MQRRPRVSIVTACRNSEKYIEDCILSVMRQTYDNVEHIIVDGCSTDRTLEIIRQYEGKYNMRWISEADSGMYDAISKGFAMATGEIFAWLNSDDMYLPWACEVAAQVMAHTDVHWLIGVPQQYTQNGVGHCIPRVTPVFPRAFIRRGYMDNRVSNFMQQESMFWSRELWLRHGPSVRDYKLAGDYHLWRSFAQSERLVTVDSVLSGIRVHPEQKSADRAAYYREVGPLSPFGRFLRKTRLIRALCLLASLTTRRLRLKLRTLPGFE